MTRLLYEVAALTEGTRNRDVQWQIQPICTSNNCSIHPSFPRNDLGVAHEQTSIFSDDHITEHANEANTDIFSDYCVSENANGDNNTDIFGDCCVSGNAKGANTDIFSDYCVSENANGDNTEKSIFSDYCINENTTGASTISSMESAEFVAKSFEIGQSISGYSTPDTQSTSEISQQIESDEFSWLKNPYVARDLTSTGSCEGVEWHDGSLDLDQWEAEQAVTRNSMTPFTTDAIEVLFVPASSSFRRNVPAQTSNTGKKEKDRTAAVVSNKKESEDSKMTRRARTFRDVLLGLRPASDLSDEEDSDLESNISEVNHQLKKIKHKPISNLSMSLSVPEPDNTGRDMASALINKVPESLVNGASGGQDDGGEAQSAPAQLTRHSQFSNGRTPAIGEERSRRSMDSSFDATSPLTKALTDSESTDNPTRKVKKKRRKLAAHFSCPSGQNRDTPRASLMNIFPIANLNFKFPVEKEQTKRESPSVGSTERDRNCVHNSRRAAIKDDNFQEIPNRAGVRLNQSSGIPSDSGLYMNGTHLADTQTSIEVGHMTDTRLEITEVETDATSGFSSEGDSRREYYRNSMSNMNKRIVLQNSPYKCKIPHGNEFIPLLEYHLPRKLQTRTNFEALLSISQRVVRLAVRKPYAPIDPFLANEYHQMQSTLMAPEVKDNTHKKTLTDNYGTGFAFYIDENHIQIRTHSHLVSSSEEARNTLIQFNIYDPTCSGRLTIECVGTSHGFYTNGHSQVSALTCVTPPDLKPFLRLFRECPTINRSSVFNDSCYFTDSSAESSFVGFEEGSVEINPNSTTVEDLKSRTKRTEYIWRKNGQRPKSPILSGSPDFFQDVKLPNLSHCPYDQPPRRSKTPILNHVACKRCEKNGSGTTEIPAFSQTPCPDIHHQRYGRRRLESNERAAHSSVWNNPTELLHVPGFEIGFTPFNSFAEDLIDSSLAKSTHSSVSPLIGATEKWDYESLIFAQSYHKDEYYHNLFKSQMYNLCNTGNQDDETTRKNPSIDEDDAFDYILLGLDTNWTPMHDDEMENMVSWIVADALEEKKKSPYNQFSCYAIMISHPHGGVKSVSCGRFSSKHFGGEFYDTPSCLGTCGAPIISFSDDGHLYLTDIIHSGTTDTAGNKVEKFGLSHFNESLYHAFSGVACV